MGPYVYYGDSIFALAEALQDNMRFESVVRQTGQRVEISIAPAYSFNLNDQEMLHGPNKPEILNFIMKVVKKTLIEHDYRQVGRLPRFFNPRDLTPINRYNLDIWPGYSTDVKYLNDGVFLNVDCATKFISQKTVYDEILAMKKSKYSNQDIVDELIPKDPNAKRLVVITMHNSRTYQPDGLTF